MSGGGRFDFDDGGSYCGGWADGKADGYAVCTGPRGQGEFAGRYVDGFEKSGIYTWPSGDSYRGAWNAGKRHGVGVETKGRWTYRGEWTQGFKGRYGARESARSGARYEGSWTTGMQDGYGVESYADGGTYEGQWLRGMRHGYGVRKSVAYGIASHYRSAGLRTSLTSLRSAADDERIVKDRDRRLDESRGGFVLTARPGFTDIDNVIAPNEKRKHSLFNKKTRSSLRKVLTNGVLKLKKQKSTGDIDDNMMPSPARRRPGGSFRSTTSGDSFVSNGTSNTNDSLASFVSKDEGDVDDIDITETYCGEWKNDKRCGFGVSERSDGLSYVGEWYNNQKCGFGTSTHKDGSKETGKYKNNALIASCAQNNTSNSKKSRLFPMRTAKLKEQVDNAVSTALRASQIASQKAEIAISSRMANARIKAEMAVNMANLAEKDAELARTKAVDYDPNFYQPGSKMLEPKKSSNDERTNFRYIPNASNSISIKSSTLPPPSRTSSSTPVNSNYVTSGSKNATSSSMTSLSSLRKRGDTGSNTPMQYAAAPTHRFSEMLSKEVVRDHFDQYGQTDDEDDLISNGQASGACTPVVFPSSRYHTSGNLGNGVAGVSRSTRASSRTPQVPSRQTTTSSLYTDDSDGYSVYGTGSRGQGSRTTGTPSGMRRSNSTKCLVDRGGPSKQGVSNGKRGVSSDYADSTCTAYVIENGVRKRLHEIPVTSTPGAEPSLPHRYRLESAPTSRLLPPSFSTATSSPSSSSRCRRGSLPDVTECVNLANKDNIMPRAEVSKLSVKRREELRIEREKQLERRRGDIVLSIGDFKDWCYDHRILLFVLLLNLCFAALFYHLLNSENAANGSENDGQLDHRVRNTTPKQSTPSAEL